MTEIGPVQESFCADASIEEDPEWGREIGQTIFAVSAFFATCAFIPACLKKKRVYVAAPMGAPAAVVPDEPPAVEAPVAEGPQPNRPIERFPRCTPESGDAERIREIFLTTQNMNTLYMWHILRVEKPRLEALGNTLRANNVHPFEFLRCAPKEAVQAIFTSWNIFKINGVMEGVIEGMERESARNNLERYIPDFAATMGKPAEQIRPLIRDRKWKEVVDYLFDIH